MATVDGITVAKAKQIEDNSVVSAAIVNGQLIFTTGDGTNINAGAVVSPTQLTNDIAAHAGDTSSHGITSAIVGETEIQSLSNKTLVAPTITSFANALHAHNTASSGGSVNLSRTSDTTSTQRTVSQADPGPKTLNTVTLGVGTWIIFGALRGVTVTAAPSSIRFRIWFTTSGGTLTTQSHYEEWDGPNLARGATIIGVLVNGTGGNVTITANFGWEGGNTGGVICDTDSFDIHSFMIAG